MVYHIEIFKMPFFQMSSASLESMLLDRHKLVIDKRIGNGGYGVVYKGTYDGRPCAVKTLARVPEGFERQEAEKSVSRDISMPMKFDHPALLPLIGYVPAEPVNQDEPWDGLKGFLTVMPLLESRNVGQMVQLELNRQGGLPDSWPTTKSKCIFGMAAGLEHMHSRGVIHRDFKLQNVLLTPNGDPCISDFGLSRVQSLDMSFQTGTPFMTAPEILEGEDKDKGDYTEKVDVYAYAVALYQLFSTNLCKMDNGMQIPRNPNTYYMHIWNAVKRGARFAKDPNIPEYIWGLIQRCWDHSPMNRPSMRDIVEELHRNEYAVPGTDMEELKRYEESLLSLMYGEEEDYEDPSCISAVPFK